jgi:alkylation response protein AidB-like acyl-CoA dehydrogenase
MHQFSGMTDTSPDALIGRARALQPFLRDAAPRIEAARELPPDVLDALHEAGLFRLLIPRDLGGAETDLVTFARVIEAVAEADASCAWCLGQGGGCAMSAAHLPRAAAWEVFGRNPRAALAWGAGVSGEAVPAEGGWRVTGRWMFASGARHATWLGGMTIRAGEDRPLTFLFPRDQVQLIDAWQVVGLRGTGSDGYALDGLFVPTDYWFDRTAPAPHPGMLYRVPLTHAFPAAFGAVALGIARAVLDAFRGLVDKTPRGATSRLRDNAAVQGLFGQMTARLAAARTFHFQTLAELWADLLAGEGLSAERALALRMASTHAIHEAQAVVDCTYHEAGATAIFDSQPFERRLRDMHAVAQQIQGRRANFELVGQHLFGMTENPLFV